MVTVHLSERSFVRKVSALGGLGLGFESGLWLGRAGLPFRGVRFSIRFFAK